jgi:GT2 family glycosyltransferase
MSRRFDIARADRVNRLSGPSPLPDVAGVVVNRDGGEALFAAIRSLEAQRGVDLSIVVVDNASQPQEREQLAREAPEARVVAFSENRGFAGAANEGIARSRAPFVLLVNNDAVLAPDYAARLAARLTFDDRLAAVQGLVLSADGARVDTAGLTWNGRGEAIPVLGGAPAASAPAAAFEVSGVSATAALYRREALETVAPQGQVFDSAFFAYYEDVDLSLRLAREGWRFACDPAAVARHALSQFRSGPSAQPAGTSALRGCIACQEARLAGSRSASARLAGPAGLGAARPRAARAAGGLADEPAVARAVGIEETSIVLVSWKDADDVEAAVASLADARRALGAGPPKVSLAVVGNGPDALNTERIRELWPEARVAVNAENRGFGPAANQGAALLSGDVLLFLNPDTRAEGEPFSSLARGFAEHPEAVGLAPRLVEGDGRTVPARPGRPLALRSATREDQFTFQLRRLPTLSADARELLLWDHLHHDGPGRRRDRYADCDRDTVFAVEQPAASALALRAGTFREAGGFDETFVPAWFEDVDLCKRLASQGPILHWPAARFRHAAGVSAQRLGYAAFLPMYYRNALKYRRKHYGLPARAAYRALLIAGMTLRLAGTAFRRHPPRPNAESRRAYFGALLTALGINVG